MKLQNHLSVRRILVLVSLIFLLLPVGSLYFLRIIESVLIRQTESDLIAQGAFVAALYQQELKQLLLEKQIPPEHYGLALPLKNKNENKKDNLNSDSTLYAPHLDFTQDSIYPARPQPLSTQESMDALASIAGSRILPILKEGQRITLAGIKVLDYHGLVVAGEAERGRSFSHAVEFQQAKMGRPVSLIRQRRMPRNLAPLNSMSRNTTVNVFVALPVVLNNRLIGVVWLNRTPADLGQVIYSKRIELGWTVLILFIVITLITLLTSLTITKPIRALVQKTRLIAQGKPEGLQSLKHPITREVAELSDSIVGMAQTIQHRSEYIRTLTAHISHAFKTPITAILGSVELLQDNLDEMPKTQQQRFLENIAEDSMRLSQLVSRLLELARADMTEVHQETTDLLPILQILGEIYPVNIQRLANLESLILKISHESLMAVFTNLLENSMQAGADRISISFALQASLVQLDIHDNGAGISQANQTQIFTPFFTTRRDSGGSGLGLSITQSLLARYGSRIMYQPSEMGTHFRIESLRVVFPAACGAKIASYGNEQIYSQES